MNIKNHTIAQIIYHKTEPCGPTVCQYKGDQNKASFLECLSSYLILTSLLLLMCAITRAHATTHATSLMHVKYSTHHLYLCHSLSGTIQQRK